MARPSLGLPETWLPAYAHVLREWLAEGRSVSLPVSGTSMWPGLAPGTRIVLAACDPAALRVADVVVYEDASRLVCHRVLGRRRSRGATELLMAGDSVRLAPAWVAAPRLVGRAVAIDADGRRRALDGGAARALALVAAARSWIALLGGWARRTLREAVMPAHAA